MYIYTAMSKAIRQRHILELVSKAPVESQNVLRRSLVRNGLRVTQATLSRDIAELGLVKTADGYSLPDEEEPANSRVLPSLDHLLREFVLDVRPAQNLLVLKTAPGAAQPVAAALDAEEWPDVVGTIGGDDTILIIARSNGACRRVGDLIREAIA